MPIPATISNQLREIINTCGMTRYAVAKLSGVDQSSMLRFMAGGELRSNSIDKICVALNLHLASKGKDHVDDDRLRTAR